MIKVILLTLTLITTSAYSDSYIDQGFSKAADKYDVPESLLRAICYAESNHRRYAYAHQDGGGGNHAIGICQILVSTGASLININKENCQRDFRSKQQLLKAGIDKEPISRIYQECKLFGPHTNIQAAAKYIKQLMKKYNYSWSDVIASYNAGSPKSCPEKGFYNISVYNAKKAKHVKIKKTCTPGNLLNQHYVDRVLKYLGK